MKKILTFLLVLSLCSTSFAQFRERTSQWADNTDFELGATPFSFRALGYLSFGFSSVLSGDEAVKNHTSFFKNPQFGFNILSFIYKPSRYFRASLGADIVWTWYQLDKDVLWVPVGSAADHVSILPTEIALMQSVKKSVFTVSTFEFPLDINMRAAGMGLQLGAALEVNLAGRTQFRGTDLAGNDVNCMGGGALYSKQIKTNTLGYNLHAAILLNHGGVFVKFRPRPVVQDGYGPQFSTWTLGLVWGLGM